MVLYFIEYFVSKNQKKMNIFCILTFRTDKHADTPVRSVLLFLDTGHSLSIPLDGYN